MFMLSFFFNFFKFCATFLISSQKMQSAFFLLFVLQYQEKKAMKILKLKNKSRIFEFSFDKFLTLKV